MKRSFIFLFTLLILAIFTFSSEKYVVPGSKVKEGEAFIPYQTEEGPESNIYIYDGKDLFIKVYSPDGEFLFRMGGRGEGPGEFKRDGRFGFTYDGKKIFATEYFQGHNWITFFSLKGKFIKTLKLPFKGFYGVVKAIDMGKDIFILRVTYSGKVFKKGKIYYYGNRDVIYSFNVKSREYFEIKKSYNDTRISNISSGGDIGIPFIPKFNWGVMQNRSILFSDGLSNTFVLLGLDGKKISSIKIPIPSPEKITSKDLDRWRKRIKEYFVTSDPGWYKTFGNVAEKYKDSIYKYKPCHNGFRITPDGNILVDVTKDEEKKMLDYYLFDSSGKLIAKICVRNKTVKISKHYIIVDYTDEDDEEEIRVYKRSGKEEKDLKRISGC